MLAQMRYIRLLLAGRSGEIRDVLIDTSGVLLGILISYVILQKLFKKFVLRLAVYAVF